MEKVIKDAVDGAVETAKKMTEVKPDPKDEDVSTLGVPYETVRALVLKLAPTQRDAIKALNAKHGIANLKVLLDKEDDFSTVNDQVRVKDMVIKCSSTQCSSTSELSFPVLMQSKRGTVFLFITADSAVCLKAGNGSEWVVGDVRKASVIGLEIFHGAVSIENDL